MPRPEPLTACGPLIDAQGGLDPAYSLYLDLVRGLAALAVVVAHFGYFHIFSDTQIAAIPDFGREAVIAFFVLSGFVIAYSAEYRYPTLTDYAVERGLIPADRAEDAS